MPTVFTKLDKLKPIYDWFYKISMIICKILLVVEIVLTSIEVFGRYVMNNSIAWNKEVVLTCMIYMALISAAMALRRGAHIRMSAFDRYLPKKVLGVLEIVADLAVFTFAIILIVNGFTYAFGIGGLGYYTGIPGLSKFWIYFPVPFSGILMFVFEIEAVYNHIKQYFFNIDVSLDDKAADKDKKKEVDAK